jgi:hypothetical protein
MIVVIDDTLLIFCVFECVCVCMCVCVCVSQREVIVKNNDIMVLVKQ